MIASAPPPRTASEATTSKDEITSASAHPKRPFDLSDRTVLLAMDSSAGAAASAQVALSLAATFRAQIHVVSVLDTRGAPIPPPLDLALEVGNELGGDAVHHAQKEEVRAILSAATLVHIDWPIRIVAGSPAGAIVGEARRLGAALIVLGLQPHGCLARATNDETVLNVMRISPCAVLAVVPSATGLPTRAVAAIDFGSSSLSAARMAGSLMRDDATLLLAYVSHPSGRLVDDGESVIHELGVDAGFARTARELARPGLAIDHVVLHHADPSSLAAMLLDYADGANSDLIAAGSARLGRLDRWIMGSVSTDLVRDGRHSLLIVPP